MGLIHWVRWREIHQHSAGTQRFHYSVSSGLPMKHSLLNGFVASRFQCYISLPLSDCIWMFLATPPKPRCFVWFCTNWEKLPFWPSWQVMCLQTPSGFVHPQQASASQFRDAWTLQVHRKMENIYPLAMERSYRKSPFLMGKSTINGHFQ